MTTIEASAHSAIRAFVEHHICELNGLLPGAFQLSETELVRSGKPCGMYFCLNGPRQVRFVAIWERNTGSVIFYDSSGQRQKRLEFSS